MENSVFQTIKTTKFYNVPLSKNRELALPHWEVVNTAFFACKILFAPNESFIFLKFCLPH